MAGQTLPTRFPCWCKAVYSWGGEVSSPGTDSPLFACSIPDRHFTNTDKARSRIHRGRPDRGPQCRRWILVDGAAEARQAHGWTVPEQLR